MYTEAPRGLLFLYVNRKRRELQLLHWGKRMLAHSLVCGPLAIVSTRYKCVFVLR
jgi:hypothetical protein